MPCLCNKLSPDRIAEETESVIRQTATEVIEPDDHTMALEHLRAASARCSMVRMASIVYNEGFGNAVQRKLFS